MIVNNTKKSFLIRDSTYIPIKNGEKKATKQKIPKLNSKHAPHKIEKNSLINLIRSIECFPFPFSLICIRYRESQ